MKLCGSGQDLPNRLAKVNLQPFASRHFQFMGIQPQLVQHGGMEIMAVMRSAENEPRAIGAIGGGGRPFVSASA